MAVTRTDTNVLVGIADMWYADVDETEPGHTTTLAEPSGGTWNDIGFTGEGAEWEIGKDIEFIRVEEQLTPVGAVVTSVDGKLSFQIAEDTPEFQALAYGIADLATTSAGAGQIGMKTLTLSEDLEYVALCVMVDNAEGFRSRIYVPKAASTGTVGTPFKRADKRIYPVEFSVLCAPSEVKIRHQTAAAS